MEKDESKSTGKGATDRGNKVGALVLVGVWNELVESHSICYGVIIVKCSL